MSVKGAKSDILTGHHLLKLLFQLAAIRGSWVVYGETQKLKLISDGDRKLISECMTAALEGTFFPEWEFPILFGIDRSELKSVLDQWPDLDEKDEIVQMATVNSMAHLLGYPHGCDKEWSDYISVSRKHVRDMIDRVTH